MEKEEKIKVQMSIEDIINNEVFEKALERKLDSIMRKKISPIASSHEFIRLDEMNLTNAKALRNAYLEVLHKKSQLPCSLRNAVVFICQPVLEAILKAAGAKPNK